MLVRIVRDGDKIYIKTPEGEDFSTDEIETGPMDAFLGGQEGYTEAKSEHGVYFSTILPDDIHGPLFSIASKTQIELEEVIFDILRDWIGAE